MFPILFVHVLVNLTCLYSVPFPFHISLVTESLLVASHLSPESRSRRIALLFHQEAHAINIKNGTVAINKSVVMAYTGYLLEDRSLSNYLDFQATLRVR